MLAIQWLERQLVVHIVPTTTSVHMWVRLRCHVADSITGKPMAEGATCRQHSVPRRTSVHQLCSCCSPYTHQ